MVGGASSMLVRDFQGSHRGLPTIAIVTPLRVMNQLGFGLDLVAWAEAGGCWEKLIDFDT